MHTAMPRHKPSGASAALTFDACMDAGVQQEERGERYARGLKAVRYVGASDQSLRAGVCTLPAGGDLPPGVRRRVVQRVGSATHRRARVHYILGSTFYWPPRAQHALTDAVDAYATAWQCTPPAQAVPDPNQLDILSNAAFAWQSLSEVEEAFPQGDPALRVRWAASIAAVLGVSVDAPAVDGGVLYTSAAAAWQHAAEGQRRVLSAEPAPGSAPRDDPSDMYTSSLVVPASLLESWCEQVTCLTALLGLSSDTNALATTYDTAQTTLRSATMYIASLPPGLGAAQSPEGEWEAQCTALDWAQLDVRTAAAHRASDLARYTDTPWPSTEDDRAGVHTLHEDLVARANTLLAAAPPAQSMTSVRGSDELQAQYEAAVQRLCDVADAMHTLAWVELRCARADDAPATWALTALAIKCLQAASVALEPAGKGAGAAAVSSAASLALPHAPMAWVPVAHGTAPVPSATNTATAVSRTRASIYATLAAIALTRTDPWLVAAYPPAAEVHARQLANARIYARRGLVDQGLAWVHHVTPPPPSEEPLVYGRARAHLPSDGWESLAEDVDMLLLYARAIWLRGMYDTEHGVDAAASLTELHALGGAVGSLRALAPPSAWPAALDPRQSVARLFVGLGEPRVSRAETQFWDEGWGSVLALGTGYTALRPATWLV